MRKGRLRFRNASSLVAAAVTLVAPGLVAQPAGRQALVDRVRQGAGTEISAARGGDVGSVTSHVQSVASFIKSRSGIGLDAATRSRLVAMEQRTRSGAAARISSAKLADALAQTVSTRMAAMSDSETDRAIESMRGFDAPNLPARYKGGRALLRTRASEAGLADSATAKIVAKSARTAAGAQAIATVVRDRAKAEISVRSKLLSDAAPSSYSTEDAGFTPAQALLIAYSAAADDHLADSAQGLNKRMADVQAVLGKRAGQAYPSPKGKFAYGPNGYLHSSPTDFLFDGPTINALLDRLEK